MLREYDQQIPISSSNAFVVRHSRVTDLHALKGMRGTWKNKHLHFKSKYLTFVATPTDEKKEIMLYGKMRLVPVYQATTTRQRIPPMFTTRKPYRHLHDTLVRKTLLDILSLHIPFNMKQIQKRVSKRCHSEQITFSKTQKYLFKPLCG